MSEAAHSYWSASGFEAGRLCPGKKALEAGAPDSTNEHAASGTASHQLLTWALKFKRDASAWIGTTIPLDGGGRVIDAKDTATAVVYSYKVDRERADRVQTCVDYVREVMALDPAAVLLVDRKVNYAPWLQVDRDSAWGTLDIAIALPTLKRLYSIDYKDGRGYVSVGNDEDGPNDQVALYALGILDELGIAMDFDDVVLAISQPRIDERPIEYQLPVSQLEAWAAKTARQAVLSAQTAVSTFRPRGDAVVRLEWEETFLKPGEKQCAFCRAKATCPALRDDVGETVYGAPMATSDDFAVATPLPTNPEPPIDAAGWVAAALSKVDQIEDWCKGVRAEAERRLLAGEDVPGYKLVAGKQGNRSWSDATEAEKVLKSMRLKDADMYDFTLISPTTAEKLAPKYDKEGKVKPTKPGAPEPLIGPRQWVKLQALITRKPGNPHVAPISDSREPLKLAPVAEDFDVIDGAVTEVKEIDPNDFA